MAFDLIWIFFIKEDKKNITPHPVKKNIQSGDIFQDHLVIQTVSEQMKNYFSSYSKTLRHLYFVRHYVRWNNQWEWNKSQMSWTSVDYNTINYKTKELIFEGKWKGEYDNRSILWVKMTEQC